MSTPSRAADLAKFVAVLVVGALTVTLGGWYWFTRGGGGVDGHVYFTGDKPHGMSIGPNGWFAYSDDDANDWVEHAPTGRRWGGDMFYGVGVPALTSDGTHVSALGPDVRIRRESGEIEVPGTDLLVAQGDRSLQPGGEVEIIGLSEQHVAVVSCMSPQSEARLGEDVDGGTLVVSGVALEDGAVTWSHDTEVGCDTDLVTLFPEGLPEQEYVLITPQEETTQALDLDTGKVAKTFEDSPRGRVIVRGDEAVHRSGDEVTVTSLRSGDEIAQVSCPGARLDGVGESGGRLAPEGTPVVRCGDSVRLLGEDGFVEVDAPPVGKNQQVPDGGSVVHDRFLISRDGDELTLRDALADKEIGTVEVEDGFRIATNDPRGRLIVFYQPTDQLFGDSPESSFRIVDTRTTELIMSKDGLSPGADVSTDGFAIVSEYIENKAPARTEKRAWVVGVDEVQRP